MIRINLLPFRAARKRENIKRQVTVYGLSVILLLVAMAYVFLQLDGRLSEVKAQETQLNQELAKHKKTIARIKTLKKKIKLIERKLGVIQKLEEGKQGPVRLLDELAKAVPKDRLWLSAMAESKGNLTLRGLARNNETVAEFMVNLEKSPIVLTVDLQSSKSTTVRGASLSQFSLKCKVDPSGKAKKTKKAQKGGSKKGG
jgi:type IV pilus assembly protein PilN